MDRTFAQIGHGGPHDRELEAKERALLKRIVLKQILSPRALKSQLSKAFLKETEQLFFNCSDEETAGSEA